MAALHSPPTSLPVLSDAHDRGNGINYELFLDCVHCGLCTSACPTYVELGTEADSPRGRIYLMRAVTDGRLELNDEVRRHLDLCLDCRACESACPSGVQYGKLIEPFRIHMAKCTSGASALGLIQRLILYHITPYKRRMRWALKPARWLQKIGLERQLRKPAVRRLLPRLVRESWEILPRLKPHYGRLPEVLPAEGKPRARVALFTGCADAFFPQTTIATVRVLQRNGCEVWIPCAQVCCGALHYHSADEEQAVRFAEANCQAFCAECAGPVDAIINFAAGCGAMLKDYGHLLQTTTSENASRRLASKVRDVSEFLMELGPIKPEHPLALRVAYHDACHLCHAQQIRKQPRQLLEMIPGLQLVSFAEPDICCGAAGSYNITQPQMAKRLGQRKAQNLVAAGVQAVFAGNVGCQLQIGRYLRNQRPEVRVAHLMDALWASYSGQSPF